MKIAISTQGKTVDDAIESRFGRCERFIIVDGTDVKVVENKAASSPHGAGTAAAQQLADEGVEMVITGNAGPKATQALESLGIKIVTATGVISKAIKPYVQVVEKAETIFIPLASNNGELSTVADHFGHAPFFGVYTTTDKKLEIVSNTLDHSSEKSPVEQIVDAHNPTLVFAKGIGKRALQLFEEKGASVKTGDQSTVKEVVANILSLHDQITDCGH